MAGARTSTLALFALAASVAPLRAQTTDVALGIEALARRDLKAAEAAFARGTEAANPLLRPTAWQWRAHLAWKIRGDTAAAKRYLSRALAVARDSSQIQLEAARLAAERHRYHDALRLAFDAMRRSVDAERRGFVARTLAALAADAAFAAPRSHVADSVDLDILAAVRDTLARRVSRFHGRTVDALALIQAAAILGDTAALRGGIGSYFALADSGVSAAVDSLAELPVTEALAAGRLYEPLALYLRASGGHRSDALSYGEWLHGLRASIERVYRAELAGTARVGDVTRALNREGRKLWSVLQVRDDSTRYYPAAFQRELARRFGTVFSVERSRGMDELFLAHRLATYTLPGDTATVVVLDGEVTSGIDDWVLEGTGGRVAWVARDTIFERRAGFAEAPFRALIALTDPQSMPAELLRTMRDSIGDVDRARRDSLGYFPGVAARMFRDGAESVLRALRSSPGGNDERIVARRFARTLYRDLTTASVALHERRHLTDLRLTGSASAADHEFRAKIEEVAGAPLPRLALTAILSPNIGDASAHGQANRRIMRGLARWIRSNGAAIAGYDPGAPALLQLPLLTDDQLRAAFRSMRVP